MEFIVDLFSGTTGTIYSYNFPGNCFRLLLLQSNTRQSLRKTRQSQVASIYKARPFGILPNYLTIQTGGNVAKLAKPSSPNILTHVTKLQ
jgi:hypothetical protein